MSRTTTTAKANTTYFNYARELNQRVRKNLPCDGVSVYRDHVNDAISFDAQEYMRWRSTDRKVARLLSELRKSVDASTQQRVINAFPYAMALIAEV